MRRILVHSRNVRIDGSLPAGNIPQSRSPVSYTHLDVYKRQELAVIPDAGHFALYSEPERVVEVVKHFLEKPVNRRPVVTAQMGYHPGETR